MDSPPSSVLRLFPRWLTPCCESTVSSCFLYSLGDCRRVTAGGWLQCFSCTLNALWAGRPLQLIPAAGGEWVHVLLTELERLWDESGTDEAADVIFIYFICLSESAWYLKWVQKSTFINDSILKKPFLKTRPSSDPLFLHRSCFGTVFLNNPSEPDGTGFFGFYSWRFC